jgi:hypothetical protein
MPITRSSSGSADKIFAGPQTGRTSSRIFFQTADTGDDHDLTAKATADSALRSRGDIGRSVAIV